MGSSPKRKRAIVYVDGFNLYYGSLKGTPHKLYINALKSAGRVTVYTGHFLSHPKRRPRREACVQCGEKYAEVIITEEKGTDVNLATHLVYDACTEAFDVAAIISNDSDLATPIEFAIKKCGKTVGIINPHPVPARTLSQAAGFYKKLRSGALEASQFPATFSAGGRTFTKPDTW